MTNWLCRLLGHKWYFPRTPIDITKCGEMVAQCQRNWCCSSIILDEHGQVWLWDYHFQMKIWKELDRVHGTHIPQESPH